MIHFRAIEIIDQMLEEYVGIRDRELSLSIYESGTKSSDSGTFLDTVTRYVYFALEFARTFLFLVHTQCSPSPISSFSTCGTLSPMRNLESCQRNQHNSSSPYSLIPFCPQMCHDSPSFPPYICTDLIILHFLPILFNF